MPSTQSGSPRRRPARAGSAPGGGSIPDRHSRSSGTPHARGALLLCASVLVTGCPQLLNDDFTKASELPNATVAGQSGGGVGSMGVIPADGGGVAGSGSILAAGSGSGTGGETTGAPVTAGAGAAAGAATDSAGGTSADGGAAAGGSSTGGTSTDGGAGGSGSGAGGTSTDAGAGGSSTITEAGAAGTAGGAGVAELPAECTAAQRAAPNFCGCEFEPSASCVALRGALALLYTFDGTGTIVEDIVGSADGEVINGSLAGTGELALSDQTFLSVPDYIASSRPSATFEIWLEWQGGAADQRIFNFGNRDAAFEQHYLALSPRASGVNGVLQVAFTASGRQAETVVSATRALPTSIISQVAVVVDDDSNRLAIYVDGAEEASASLNGSLSALKDTTDWVGRSLTTDDLYLAATLYEFRVYDAALTADDVATSAEIGPDAEFLMP